MQRQHRRKLAFIVGDQETPAFLYLERNARAQLRQQEIACRFETGRSPAVHPDAGDLVIFVGAGGTDRWWRHSNCPRQQRRRVWRKEEAPRDNIARASSTQSNAEVHSAACEPGGILCCGAVSVALGRAKNLSAAIRRGRSGRGSSPWSTP